MNIVRKDIDQSNATVTLRIEKNDYAEKVEKHFVNIGKKPISPDFARAWCPWVW